MKRDDIKPSGYVGDHSNPGDIKLSFDSMTSLLDLAEQGKLASHNIMS